MTTAATPGKGLIFSRGNGESPTETFTPIAEVLTFGQNGAKAETIDVSNMDSGDYREFIPGFKDAGQVPFSVNFLPGNAGHIALLQDHKDGTKRNYQVEFTDPKVAARRATGTEGGNNGITWTAVRAGRGGNDIQVAIVNPGGTGALSVSVSGKTITVTVARTSGTITSTASQVRTAVAANLAAAALVSTANTGASSGASAVVAVGATHLAGGRGSLWVNPGFVESYDVNADPNSQIDADFTIRVSGAPTIEGVS